MNEFQLLELWGEKERERSELFLQHSHCSSPQESLTKIKACLVDNKKHIRFGEWNSNDVSSIICSRVYLCNVIVTHVILLVTLSTLKRRLGLRSEDHSDFKKFNKLSL